MNMKTIKSRIALTLVAAFVLMLSIACEHAASPTATNELSQLDFSSIAEPAGRWQAYGLKNYSIEQKRVCFCRFPHGFVRLTVEDNKITGGIDLTTNQPVPPETLQYYQTINELFAWIKEAQALNPVRLEIEYNARFGYPEKIAFDYSTDVADDELWIEIQELKK